ncbi:MAG: hypothetical protein KF862_05565 [Chitinophagaceae bacterium]|nr:hypothetical protein [Chitinophagaceae bacterium]
MYRLLGLIICFLGLFLITNKSYAQSPASIDSLITETYRLNYKENDVQTAMDVAFRVIELSRKTGYERGIVIGLYTVAVFFRDSHDYEKSIAYAEKAKAYTSYLSKNPSEAFNLLELQASNHYELGIQSTAEKYWHQAEEVLLNVKDSARQNYYRMILYMKASRAYKDKDSLYFFTLKAKELNEQVVNIVPENVKEEILMKKAEICEKLGNYHEENGNTDSARYYYNLLLDVAGQMNSELAVAYAFGNLGALAESEGDYTKALDYLGRSEAVFINNAIFSNLMPVYEIKQRIYGKLGDKEKEKEYLALYTQLSDSLERVKGKGRDKAILQMVNEKEAELTRQFRTTSNKMIIFFSVSALLVIAGGYLLFRTYRRRKTIILQEQKQLLDNTNEVLREKEEAVEELHKKVNEAFDDLIEMAKSNDPQFWTRFKEVYPGFAPGLLAVNPNLKSSELTLCAYIYLGFTTKEIATYTFKALKTVESNRYNLRKRLDLSPEQDLLVYLNGIIV